MYQYESRVSYSQLNEEEKLSLPAILNYLQDCSTFESEDLEVGMEFLNQENRAWLLAEWQIFLEEDAKIGDPLTIATWPYRFDSSLGYRNLEIKSKDRIIARARSKWFLIDTEKERPVRLTEEITGAYELGPAFSYPEVNYKIRMAKEEFKEYPRIMIPAFAMDTNHHMNNQKYLEFALEYLPEDREIKKIVIQYKVQCKKGEWIKPVSFVREDLFVVGFVKEDGKVAAFVAFR